MDVINNTKYIDTPNNDIDVTINFIEHVHISDTGTTFHSNKNSSNNINIITTVNENINIINGNTLVLEKYAKPT